jgi:general secretion pathway protein H
LPSPQARGFTLIEIMVVIVIAGIMVSLAVITISDRSTTELEQEGKRLHALMRLMTEEAIMQSREIGLAFNLRGYQFYELDEEDKWQVIASDDTLRQREILEDIRIRLYADGEEVRIEQKMPEIPSLFFYSSGENTPFELELSLGDYQQIITANALGDIKLAAITER